MKKQILALTLAVTAIISNTQPNTISQAASKKTPKLSITSISLNKCNKKVLSVKNYSGTVKWTTSDKTIVNIKNQKKNQVMLVKKSDSTTKSVTITAKLKNGKKLKCVIKKQKDTSINSKVSTSSIKTEKVEFTGEPFENYTKYPIDSKDTLQFHYADTTNLNLSNPFSNLQVLQSRTEYENFVASGSALYANNTSNGKITFHDEFTLLGKTFNLNFFENNYLAIYNYDCSFDSREYCFHQLHVSGSAIYIDYNFTQFHYGGPLAPSMAFELFAIPKENVTSIQLREKYNYYDNDWAKDICFKPIIYLYPEKQQEIEVTLGAPDKLTCTYPKYKNSWNVLAEPDGTLKDLTTGKSLYSLYYESKNIVDFKQTEDGFVVKGEDAAEFLEEKLAILGLNYKEAEEFILYWLPKLEANKYNYIRFATENEINKNMPLSVSGNPDTVIRVLMEMKALDAPISVKEQVLTPKTRSGFTVVEWGGTFLTE